MKKPIRLLAIVLLGALLCAGLAGCGGNSKEKEALAAHTWYVTDSSYNACNTLRFQGDKVKLVHSFVDGNGVHEQAEVTGSVHFKDGVISLDFGSSAKSIEIPYSFDNEVLTLDSQQCLSEEQVMAQLQGAWTYTDRGYVYGTAIAEEHNLVIDGKNIEMEYAAKARPGTGYDYFFYGPYSGSFELGNGSIVSDMEHSNSLFFRVKDGGVELFNYTHQFSAGSGLVGQDGYSF